MKYFLLIRHELDGTSLTGFNLRTLKNILRTLHFKLIRIRKNKVLMKNLKIIY